MSSAKDTEEGQRPVQTEQGGVSVLKYLDTEEFDEHSALFYNITNGNDSTVSVKLSEIVPGEISFSNLQYHSSFHGNAWGRNGERIEFTYTLSPDETITTLVAIAGKAVEALPGSFVNSPPKVSVKEAIDAYEDGDTGSRLLIDQFVSELESGNVDDDVRHEFIDALVEETDLSLVDEGIASDEVEGAMEELREARSQFKTIQDELAEMRSSQVSSENRFEMIQKRFDNLQSETEMEISEFKDELSKLRRDVDMIESATDYNALDGIGEDVNQLVVDVDDLNDRLEEIEGVVDDDEMTLSEVQERLSEAAGEFDSIAARFGAVADKFSSVDDEIQAVKEEVDQIETNDVDPSHLANRFSKIEDQLSMHESEIREMQRDIQNELDVAESQRRELADKIMETQTGVERVANNQDDIVNEVEVMQSYISRLDGVLANVVRAIESMQSGAFSDDVVEGADSGSILNPDN